MCHGALLFIGIKVPGGKLISLLAFVAITNAINNFYAI